MQFSRESDVVLVGLLLVRTLTLPRRIHHQRVTLSGGNQRRRQQDDKRKQPGEGGGEKRSVVVVVVVVQSATPKRARECSRNARFPTKFLCRHRFRVLNPKVGKRKRGRGQKTSSFTRTPFKAFTAERSTRCFYKHHHSVLRVLCDEYSEASVREKRREREHTHTHARTETNITSQWEK